MHPLLNMLAPWTTSADSATSAISTTSPTSTTPAGSPASALSSPPRQDRRRVAAHLLTLGAGVIAPPLLLGGCAGPQLSDFTGRTPVLDFRAYFTGRVMAHGLVMDRSGQVRRRMVVTMDGRWDGDAGTLDEAFVYDDGERVQRQWRLRRLPDGRYTGTADDAVGSAEGASAGPAFQWRYTLKVPVGERVHELDFDDWMVLIDDRTMINKAVMSKFGVRVGEVLLSFTKAP